MDNSTVQSVERVFSILEALSEYPKGISLGDLAETVSLHKSTVFRLLSTLGKMNYITKDTSNGKYKLTIRLFEIGSRALDGFDLLTVSRPYLEKLTALTNEVTHLVVPDEQWVVYLYKQAPHNFSIMSSEIGMRNYMYCTGVGKSIMAAGSDEEVIRVWHNSEIIPYTPSTITSLASMQEEVKKIRRLGYAIDNEEHEPGIRCVAAAITDFSGRAIAAVSLAATVYRMPDERIQELAPLVISTAKNISSVFGGN